jgi:AbrB family looped-hinge helix DNA binding protein
MGITGTPMTKPLVSRLTSKGQATVPAEVRKALQLQSGDRVAFDLGGGKVTLRKVDALDRAFLKLSEMAFEEWNSAEDEAAFRDL